MKSILITIAIIIGVCVISFLECALLIGGICFVFGLEYSWRVTVGIWLIIILVRVALKQEGKG